MFTLRRLLTNLKDKEEPEDSPEAANKIKCFDCQATCIGETGRNLTTRLNECKRATKKGDLNNNIAEHPLKQATLSTGTLLRVLPTEPSNINELHSKAGLLT